MAIRIVKNTTPSPVEIRDLSVIVPASGQADLTALGHDIPDLAQSTELIEHIASGELVLNVGKDEDETMVSAIDIIRNISQSFQSTPDNKMVVISTPRYDNTTYYMASRQDAKVGGIGNCAYITMTHKPFEFGDTEDEFSNVGKYIEEQGACQMPGYTVFDKYWLNTMYVDLNTIDNETYLYDGGMSWVQEGTSVPHEMLALTVTAVPKVHDPTPYITTPGTGNATLLNGVMIVPHPTSQGEYTLPLGQTTDQTPQDINFVGTVPGSFSGKTEVPYFWSMDYDLTQKKWFNLLPVADPFDPFPNRDTGNVNIKRTFGNFFTFEMNMQTMVKDMLLLGDSAGYMPLGSPDVVRIGANIRIKVEMKTIVTAPLVNHDWTFAGYLKMYRETTI